MRDHLGNFVLSSDMQFSRGVILLEDCEGTMNWEPDGTGADYAVTFETAAAFSGTKGMQMVSRATTPAEDDEVSADHWIEKPESGLLVMRARMSGVDISLWKIIYLDAIVYNGVRRYYMSMSFSPNSGAVKYRNSAGAYVTVTSLAAGIIDNMWFTIEVILNVRDMFYRQVRVGSAKTDLVDVLGYDGGEGTCDAIKISIRAATAGAAQAKLYVDSLYVGEFENV